MEARLCLGATRWQATHGVVRASLRTALMPIVNTMAATGLVALPGMMTGQILAGGVLRLTDERHRLRLDRLR